MTRDEYLVFCKKCLKREFNPQQGLICNITDQKADFEGECKDFELDESVKEVVEPEIKTNTEMINELSDDIREKLIPYQNMEYAAIGGFLLAILCALIWAVITVTTQYQIAYMAIGVGFVVGMGVRFFGSGIDQIYGILGAILALVGCLLGNLFSQIGFIAQAQSLGYLNTFKLLDSETIILIFTDSFSPMDLLFYGFAIFEGYKFAFRPITPNIILMDDFTPKYAHMRLPLVIISVVIISISGFVLSKGIEGQQTFYHESGEIMSTGEYVDGKEQGLWKYYSENGVLLCEATYENGIEHGPWHWYSENEKLTRTGHYEHGLNDSIWINYFENGNMSDSATYEGGRLNGMAKAFHESGNILQSGSYKRDRMDGLWLAYYDNGQLNSKGTYDAGTPKGFWNFWLDNGKMSLELDYENEEKFKILNTWDVNGESMVVNGEGKHKVFYNDGTLLETGKITNGYRTGVWKSYHQNGQLKSEGAYKDDLYLIHNTFKDDGKALIIEGEGEFVDYYPSTTKISEIGQIKEGLREGKWLTYFENSNSVMIDCDYSNGKVNGIYTTYFEDGTVMAKGQIVNDKKEGEWSWFYPSGQLQTQASYEIDKKYGKQLFWSESGIESKEEIYEDGELISEEML